MESVGVVVVAANRRPQRSQPKTPMQFKLSKKSTGRTLTTFNITDDKDTICGSVNVPDEAVADLQKCWRDSAPAAATAAGNKSARPTRWSRLFSGDHG